MKFPWPSLMLVGAACVNSAVLADAARVVTTLPQPASAPAAAGEAGAAHGAAKPLPKDDTTPDPVYALLAPLEVET